MNKSVGDISPDIKTVDVLGKKVNVSKSKTPYVLVAFLRYAGCPFCNLTVHRFAMEHGLLLDSGCDIIAFIQSSKDQVIKNIYERHKVIPKFHIIADQQKQMYGQFGVKPSYKTAKKMIEEIPHWLHAVRDHGFKQGKIDGNFLIAPALFVIHTKTGKIIHVDYSADLFSHDTFSPIYDKILTQQT